jgi:dolichyl-phosphate-mannose--protein O-mannosyl transferase
MTDTEQLSRRRFFIGLALVTIFAAVLRIYWLAGTQPTGDEFYTIEEAFDYMLRGHFGLVEWHHPKLRDIFEFYSINMLGLNLVGFRFASLLFGILTVPLTALVARRLTGCNAAALLAALFIAVDPIHIMFSRQSIQEEYVPFFSLLGIYLALRYLADKKAVTLICAGIIFGLGLASKWNVAAPLVLSLILLTYRCLKQQEASHREKWTELLFYFSALVILPVTVYMVTYLPWLQHRGYDLGEWLRTQRLMFAENLVHQGANPAFDQVQDHNPRVWFIRPVGFADFMMNGNRPTIVLAVSNPLVWLLTLPAVGYLMSKMRRLDCFHLFLLAMFWCSYLPFAISRRVTVLNSSLGVTPFAFMAIATVVISLLRDKPNRNLILYAYIGLVLAVAIPLYLMAIGNGFGTILQPVLELYRPMHER